MPKYDETVPLIEKAERSPFKELTRHTPDRAGNALVLLVFVAGTMFLAWICFLLLDPENAGIDTGIFGIVVLILAVLAVFTGPHTIHTVEKATGWDIDGDGSIGPPPAEPQEHTLVIVRDDVPGYSESRITMSEDMLAKLPQVCAMILNGTPFSESGMAGTGRPLSRNEFLTLRDAFFAHGICEWKDAQHHTLGVRFTAYGRNFLKKAVQEYYSIDTPTTPPRTRTPRGVAELPPTIDGGEEYN